MKIKIKKIITENIENFKYSDYHVFLCSNEFDIIPHPDKPNSDVGLDLYSTIDFEFHPKQVKVIPTGVKSILPIGLHLEIRPRSSLFLKKQLILVNSPGTIDPDYRGEIGLILWNPTNNIIEIKKGDKLCQACLIPYIPMNSEIFCSPIDGCTTIKYYLSKNIFENWKKLSSTKRGEGSFGSTKGYK